MNLQINKPCVTFQKAPLKPLATPRVERSVVHGHSVFLVPQGGLSDLPAPQGGCGDLNRAYEPLEDGGFHIRGSRRVLNRVIAHGQNKLYHGDLPLFRLNTGTGGRHAHYCREQCFPLFGRFVPGDWGIPDISPSLGSVRLGICQGDGQTLWLDEVTEVATTFRPGYARYELTGEDQTWRARLIVAPTMDFHGLVCSIEFDSEMLLVWRFGGIYWTESEANANKVEADECEARITEQNLGNALVLAGWDGDGRSRVIEGEYGEQVEFAAQRPQALYHVATVWGVTAYDEDRARRMTAHLNRPASSTWPKKRDRLKQLWFDCFVGRALSPQENFRSLMADPGRELRSTIQWWDKRRLEFQIRTPDPHLDALINAKRCESNYYRFGPGLVGTILPFSDIYAHISPGWWGKQWAGDHEAMEDCLRLYGAMQLEAEDHDLIENGLFRAYNSVAWDGGRPCPEGGTQGRFASSVKSTEGCIPWIAPSLEPLMRETNTQWWIDQVWWHYAWTGDTQFVHDLWPAVKKAAAWVMRENDPDDDGLFGDWYEYWNSDSGGRGPKAATASVMGWAVLDRAARMAQVVGDTAMQKQYRQLADRSRQRILDELWDQESGQLGSIGADGIWQGHPPIWDQFLAVEMGLLRPDQARRAMRWAEAHYSFEPNPGVRLLSCSDRWPLRWSDQWVATGDTCRSALAGMKGGDADLWWPYLQTVVRSAFRHENAGIGYWITDTGASGSDVDCIDNTDSHVHAVVRGLFGIEPGLAEPGLDICPAFPSHWREASIRTPDLSYEYRRESDEAVFHITTPRPVVKRVRVSPFGTEVCTGAEKESTLRLKLAAVEAPSKPLRSPTILTDLCKTGGPGDTPMVNLLNTDPDDPDVARPAPLDADSLRRQVLFDLGGACNVTSEEMVAMKFIYDYDDTPIRLYDWWSSLRMEMPAGSPRMVEAATGVSFLTAGRGEEGPDHARKNLVALSSWRPYPLPAAAVIPVGLRCDQVWLLLQGYVHPWKNYIPNGEIVLQYKTGQRTIVQLIPPFNLDSYDQHFSLQGVPVAYGRLLNISPRADGREGWTPVPWDLSVAHADALAMECDPRRELEAVELRAVCSEGLIGLAGMTAIGAEAF